MIFFMLLICSLVTFSFDAKQMSITPTNICLKNKTYSLSLMGKGLLSLRIVILEGVARVLHVVSSPGTKEQEKQVGSLMGTQNSGASV